MSVINPQQGGIASQLKQIVDKLSSLQSQVDALEDENEELDISIEILENQIEKKDEKIEELESKVEELESDRKIDRRERAADRQRLTKVEEKVNDVDLDEVDSSSDDDPKYDEMTPIEQIAQTDDVGSITSSVSVERAVTLFQNIGEWGRKTPKGIVLRPADQPVRLLEADRNEELAWKQYYRAAKKLESLSQGSVTFFDSDKHGKILLLHEQSGAYERYTNGY